MNELELILDSWRLWQTAQNLSERTIAERARVVSSLVAFTGEHPLELTAESIMRFTTRPEIRPSARSTYHASIRAYSKWLVRCDRRDVDPTEKLIAPKRPRGVAQPVPSDGLQRMLAVANRRRTRMMVLLAVLGGLRVHEIAKFHGGDLDLESGVITVTGKGGDTMMIPAHEDIITAALEFPRDDWWFPSYEAQSPSSAHMSRAGIYAALKSVMKRAGVNSKPHNLRHWYGTELLAAGVDIRIVQELMRHVSIVSTQRYTRVSMSQMRAGMVLLQLPSIAPIGVKPSLTADRAGSLVSS